MHALLRHTFNLLGLFTSPKSFLGFAFGLRCLRRLLLGGFVLGLRRLGTLLTVSYTHLTLPTN